MDDELAVLKQKPMTKMIKWKLGVQKSGERKGAHENVNNRLDL